MTIKFNACSTFTDLQQALTFLCCNIILVYYFTQRAVCDQQRDAFILIIDHKYSDFQSLRSTIHYFLALKKSSEIFSTKIQYTKSDSVVILVAKDDFLVTCLILYNSKHGVYKVFTLGVPSFNSRRILTNCQTLNLPNLEGRIFFILMTRFW